MGLVTQKYSDDFMSFYEFLKFRIVYFDFIFDNCPFFFKYGKIKTLFDEWEH